MFWRRAVTLTDVDSFVFSSSSSKMYFCERKKKFSRFYKKIHIFMRKNENILQEKYSFYVCNIDIIRKKLLIFFSQNVVVFFWGGERDSFSTYHFV